jgi:hypothetical protein
LLLNISEYQYTGRDEIGGVRKIWDSLRGHTEAVGLAHLKVRRMRAASYVIQIL